MTSAFWFWIFMALWLVLGVVQNRSEVGKWHVWGGDLILFILLFLVGWKVFGFPIQG